MPTYIDTHTNMYIQTWWITFAIGPTSRMYVAFSLPVFAYLCGWMHSYYSMQRSFIQQPLCYSFSVFVCFHVSSTLRLLRSACLFWVTTCIYCIIYCRPSNDITTSDVKQFLMPWSLLKVRIDWHAIELWISIGWTLILDTLRHSFRLVWPFGPVCLYWLSVNGKM